MYADIDIDQNKTAVLYEVYKIQLEKQIHKNRYVLMF